MASEGSKGLMRGSRWWRKRGQNTNTSEEKREEKDGGERRGEVLLSAESNGMQRLGKIQLKCGVKTGFEVGHGA